jgi:hypothetical protein
MRTQAREVEHDGLRILNMHENAGSAPEVEEDGALRVVPVPVGNSPAVRRRLRRPPTDLGRSTRTPVPRSGQWRTELGDGALGDELGDEVMFAQQVERRTHAGGEAHQHGEPQQSVRVGREHSATGVQTYHGAALTASSISGTYGLNVTQLSANPLASGLRRISR